MSIFAFLGGRHNRRAWGQALFAAGCRLPAKPDPKRYEKLTDQIIAADCRSIQQNAKAVMQAKSDAVRSRRKMLLLSRVAHLQKLEPYASRKQKPMIREAHAAAARAKHFR